MFNEPGWAMCLILSAQAQPPRKREERPTVSIRAVEAGPGTTDYPSAVRPKEANLAALMDSSAESNSEIEDGKSTLANLKFDVGSGPHT